MARITALIQQAISVGAVTESAGLLRVTASDNPGDGEPTGEPGGQPDGESATRRPLRAVIVDLESVVRTTATEPYTEKRIYQIAARPRWRRPRLGRRRDAASPAGSNCPTTTGPSSPTGSGRTCRARGPARRGARRTARVHRGADVVVAYNGFAADFPLLGEACDREGLQRLPGEYVDAYYLTLACGRRAHAPAGAARRRGWRPDRRP